MQDLLKLKNSTGYIRKKLFSKREIEHTPLKTASRISGRIWYIAESGKKGKNNLKKKPVDEGTTPCKIGSETYTRSEEGGECVFKLLAPRGR